MLNRHISIVFLIFACLLLIDLFIGTPMTRLIVKSPLSEWYDNFFPNDYIVFMLSMYVTQCIVWIAGLIMFRNNQQHTRFWNRGCAGFTLGFVFFPVIDFGFIPFWDSMMILDIKPLDVYLCSGIFFSFVSLIITRFFIPDPEAIK